MIFVLAASAAGNDMKTSLLVSPELSFPLVKSAYAVMPGVSAGLKIIQDNFLFIGSINSSFGAGEAAVSEGKLYGIYPDEWFVAENGGGSAVYFNSGISALFGWQIASFFGARQYIAVSFGGIYESEKIKTSEFSGFGRYTSGIFLAGDLPRIFGIKAFGKTGYTRTASVDSVKNKDEFGGFFVSIGGDFPCREAGAGDAIYKSGEEKGKDKVEGEALWE